MSGKNWESIDLERFSTDTGIVAVAQALGYDLQRSGKDFVSHCPACGDEGKKRHLYLYPATNAYKCHKCGSFKGGVFNLIMQTVGTDKAGVFAWIRNRYGISYASGNHLAHPAPQPKPRIFKREKFVACKPVPESHLDIYRSFYGLLAMPTEVLDYLSVRRCIPTALIHHYGLRGIHGNQDLIASKLTSRYAIADLVAAGLFNTDDKGVPYFRFYDDCVVFPHRYRGELVFFSTRNLEIRQQGRKSFPMPGIVMFNLDALEKHTVIYIFEGIINGISYHVMSGVDNFVCTLGIKPDECLKLAAAYPGIEFRLAYDPDEAGLKAAESIRGKCSNLQIDPGYYDSLIDKYLPERGLRGQPKSMDMNDILCHLGYMYEERAAIIEFDGCLPRAEAVKITRALVLRDAETS